MTKWTYTSGDAIFTDAGWATLSYQEALQHFAKEEIEAWWLDYTSEIGIEDLCEELEIDPPNEDDEDAIATVVASPKSVSAIIAKACYGQQKWVSVIALPDGTPFFDKHEKKGILLGTQLREELSLDVPVVNDNRNAVKEMKEKYPNIKWARRGRTKAAHNFSFEEATLVTLRS